MSRAFARFANKTAHVTGHYVTFTIAVLIVVVWAISGPFFAFSEGWQLVINTGTTVGTFLMVFLIQNTQNRDAMAVHLKLDELIRAIDTADNEIIVAEEETDEELAALKKRYTALLQEHHQLKSRLGQEPAPGHG